MNDFELHQLGLLNRIALALEAIALTNAPAPNFVKPIEMYAGFDFTSIGAVVKAKDANGPTELEWGGYLWTRRSPQNKFGEAIWFSRPTSKDAEGNVKYSRLITFKKLAYAEPLPRKVEALVTRPAGQAPNGTGAKPQQPDEPEGESELDKFFGPNPRTTEPVYETVWPTTKAEFDAWITGRGWNGKETRSALGTDAASWMKANGKGWADAAQTIAAVLGK